MDQFFEWILGLEVSHLIIMWTNHFTLPLWWNVWSHTMFFLYWTYCVLLRPNSTICNVLLDEIVYPTMVTKVNWTLMFFRFFFPSDLFIHSEIGYFIWSEILWVLQSLVNTVVVTHQTIYISNFIDMLSWNICS